MRFLAFALLTTPLFAADFIIPVSPGGPVSTLAKARDAARSAHASQPESAVRVQFATGRYALTKAVAFGPQDSGSERAPIIYEAAPGAVPVLSAGKPVTGWKAASDGLWQAAVEPADAFGELWVNGRRAIVARTPNAVVAKGSDAINGGYWNMHSQAGSEIFPGVKDTAFKAFVLRAHEYELLRAIPADERSDVLLTAMHTWTVGQFRIDALHDTSRSVLIKGRSRYPFVQFEPDQRCYVENYRAALDAPGEWFLDKKTHTVFYKPMPGEDMARAEVVAPVAEQFIVIKGDAKTGKRVEHLTFRGLSFHHGNFVFGPEGHHDGQAASGIGAAIELEDAAHIAFENCEIAHVGLYALFFHNGCADCSITHSHLHDLGAGGVRIGDIKQASEAQTTQRILVDDCIIQRAGRIFPSACGVFLANAADCAVTHCDIGDLYYTGISAGWVWGYAPSPSKRNRFDYNHLHHIGWGVLSDMGGFYGLGRAEGTTVSHNYVHDIASYRYGGWGLYTDEGSTGVTLENNLVHDTSEAGFHQHYGKWNQVSNNIFAFGKKAQFQRTRPEPHASFAYEHNIVLYAEPVLLDGGWRNWETGTYEMRNNLYWNTAGLPVKFLDTDLAGWQKKVAQDEGSLVADPLFANAEKRDFTLSKDSPALKLGFKPFDPREAGVRRDNKSWRALAESGHFADYATLSKPWPMPEFVLDEDFEFLSLGMPSLPRSEIRWQNKGDNMLVTEEAAAAGSKRSLKALDAPDLKPSWDPHLVLKPGYKTGRVEASFDMMAADAATMFYHEWRDAGSTYHSGPSFHVRQGFIALPGSSTRVALPPGQWMHVEISTQLGSGKWALSLTPQGAAAQAFKDLPCSPDWQAAEWIGFISDAQVKTAFYLDNLKLHREP